MDNKRRGECPASDSARWDRSAAGRETPETERCAAAPHPTQNHMHCPHRKSPKTVPSPLGIRLETVFGVCNFRDASRYATNILRMIYLRNTVGTTVGRKIVAVGKYPPEVVKFLVPNDWDLPHRFVWHYPASRIGRPGFPKQFVRIMGMATLVPSVLLLVSCPTPVRPM